MSRRLCRTLVPLFLLVLAPLGLTAQQEGLQDPAQLPPEAQEMVAEMQQIEARLQPVEQQALQDPQIQAEQQALGARIQEAMVEVDPATPQRMERLQALMAEARAAQSQQDGARATEIVAEARQIEQSLRAAQVQAVRQPEVTARVEDFRTKVREKMVEVDPQTEPLLERYRELDARLAAVLGQQG